MGPIRWGIGFAGGEEGSSNPQPTMLLVLVTYFFQLIVLVVLDFFQLDGMKKMVAEMSGGGNVGNVRVAVSPYRICPLGAHIDHQVSW